MTFHELMVNIVVYFLTAITAVALSKKFGLGAIIGYLLAGIIIGPSVLGVVNNPDIVLQFSELGIVLLLFVIGLELSPVRLIKMRQTIFYVGGGQVFLSAVLITGAAALFIENFYTAIVIGCALALSSTAFSMQMLSEKHMLGTRFGQRAFGILLFQDLIVIPFLALMPLLSPLQGETSHAAPLWLMLLAPVVIITISHYALTPILAFFAKLHLQDAFIALVLALVIGFALLFEEIGYSMGLGAFIAGILLAESEYRHQVEATAEPFKGLLLGLFFVAVGMGVPLSLLWEEGLAILGIVSGLLLIKLMVLLLLGKLCKLDSRERRYFAISLAQGGEFAFVLFAQASSLGLLSEERQGILIAAVAVSMIISQLMFSFYHSRVSDQANAEPPEESLDIDHKGKVIIAGFGRFGQIVGRILSLEGVTYTAIDNDPEQLEFLKKFGNRVFYGDVTDMELLERAGASEAELLVLAIDNMDASVQAVKLIKEAFPNLAIIARARNREHAYRLKQLNLKYIYRETLDTSLRATQKVLERLGFPDTVSSDAIRLFREYDEASIHERDDTPESTEELIKIAEQNRRELKELFKQDAKQT